MANKSNAVRKSKTAQREERRLKVAANLLAGLSYRDMSKALDVSLGTIANDVRILLGRWQKEQVIEFDEYALLELRRIDVAINSIWEAVRNGDLSAINTMIRLIETSAKFKMGFKEKIEITGEDGKPISIDSAIERELAKLASGR